MNHPHNQPGRRHLPPQAAQHAAEVAADLGVPDLRQRTPEDDVPEGDIWTPRPEDKVSRRDQAERVIPSFIPRRLSEANADQMQFASGIVADQIKSGERSVTDIPENMRGGAPAPLKPKKARAPLPDDFDEDVDDEDDDFVGYEGLAVADTSQQDMLRNAAQAGRQARQEKAPAPEPTSQMAPELARAIRARTATPKKNADGPVDVSDRPGIMEEHPVLAKLRARYGRATLDIQYVEIDGISYGFRKYNNQTYIKFVTNRVLPTIETDAELHDKHAYAIAAISLASIDGVPCHEVFSVVPQDDDRQLLIRQSPLDPPASVVIDTAEELFKWFLFGGIPELADDLARAYKKLFPEVDLTGDKKLWIFKCPHPGCRERLERLPEYDAEQNMLSFFCPTHGIPMRALGSKEELGNVPLD